MSESRAAHFERHGFCLIPNPLTAMEMAEIEGRQREVEPCWRETQWPKGPKGVNVMACQFFMVGEPLLRLVEKPELLELARRLLGCDQVHSGACALGDSLLVIDHCRAHPQVHWHCDGGPEERMVSIRLAFDRHDASNAPLRVLPGTHLRPREEVKEEIMQLELASGDYDEEPDLCFCDHPQEVEVRLDPRWALMWTPSLWHATGVKTADGPRRAVSFNYYPQAVHTHNVAAIKHVLDKSWQNWSDARKTLWCLDGST